MTEEKSHNILLPNEIITSKIYLIRGEKVMLDRDLSILFDVKTIRLREQVKRNFEKFPMHFMFQLTNEEVEIMVSQNAIPSKQHLGGSLPYVFTEHGVLQLANVLKSSRATHVSIKIIEVFVKMRELLSTQKEILQKLDQLEKRDIEQDEKIMLIFEYLKQFEKVRQAELEYKNRPNLGFKTSKEK
jgi:DNA-binding transcriptional MerR regulator